MKKLLLMFLLILQFIKADDYIVLVDLSDDVTGEVKAKYLNSFEKINFTFGDKFFLFPISASSQIPQPAAEIIIENKESGRSDKYNLRQNLEPKLEEIQDSFFDILSTTEDETRIIDALINSGRIFEMNNTPSDKRKIIIFSDMVEYSSIHKHWFKKKILDINTLDIPNLNAEVTIYGLGVNYINVLENSQIKKVEKFWEEYFKRANSKLHYETLK